MIWEKKCMVNFLCPSCWRVSVFMGLFFFLQFIYSNLLNSLKIIEIFHKFTRNNVKTCNFSQLNFIAVIWVIVKTLRRSCVIFISLYLLYKLQQERQKLYSLNIYHKNYKHLWEIIFLSLYITFTFIHFTDAFWSNLQIQVFKQKTF